jgi:hypothetical protein
MSQEPTLKSRKESNGSEQIKPSKRAKAEENQNQPDVPSSHSSTSLSEIQTNESEWSYGPPPSISSIDSATPELTNINPASQVPLKYPEFQDAVLPTFGRQSSQSLPDQTLDPFAMPHSVMDSYQQIPSNTLGHSQGQMWTQNDIYDPNADISRLYARPKRAIMSSEQSEATSRDQNDDEPSLANFKNIEFMFNLGPNSFPERLAKSTDHEFIRQNLMKIYHDSMENALSCWLNERTCPYRIAPKAITSGEDADSRSLNQAWSEDWPNRIFARVNNLDRVSGRFRDRPLSRTESDAASKALYFVIMAFASQWAQSSRRSKEQHPPMFGNGQDSKFFNNAHGTTEGYYEFDRVVQQTYWNEARKALLDCADVESFKVAFANIIFSLTQKPMSEEQQLNIRNDATSTIEELETDLDSLQDRVTKIIDEDGPPIYLEQGVRHAHSLRHKLQRREREMAKQKPGVDPTKTILNEEDRTTVDMVAWLGYMLESLTSAMHQRPLVVADEDTDVLPQSLAALNLSDPDDRQRGHSPVSAISQDPTSTSRLWDDYFFLQEAHNQKDTTQHPPMTHNSPYLSQAAFLTDAAPMKVLLFRKLTHLQSLLTRYASPSKIESGIGAAVTVYNHWISTYEPFIKDCIAYHDRLNPRIQSWYICLTGHFHLAALLFADILESIDTSAAGLESHAAIRKRTHLVAHLRQHNARMVSDLARCSTPRADASFAQTGERWHFALNAGALLTEPWTALLIRVFSKAAVLLLAESADEAGGGRKASSGSPEDFMSSSGSDRGRSTGRYDIAEQLAHRADDCIRALKYLGRKSDTAKLAGDTLDKALRRRWGALKDGVKSISPEARPSGLNGINVAAPNPSGSIVAGVPPDVMGQQQHQHTQSHQQQDGTWFDPVVLGPEDAWLGVGLEQELSPDLGCFPGQNVQGIGAQSGRGIGEEKWEWM